MTTEPDRDARAALYQLSSRQTTAVELVVAGLPDREVAEQIGVTRQTVNGWRNHHPAFIAALNWRHREMREGFAIRVMELQLKALEVVGAALEAGDVQPALAFLKLGLPVPAGNGPVVAEQVVEEKTGSPVKDLMDRLDSAETRPQVERDLLDRLASAGSSPS